MHEVSSSLGRKTNEFSQFCTQYCLAFERVLLQKAPISITREDSLKPSKLLNPVVHIENGTRQFSMPIGLIFREQRPVKRGFFFFTQSIVPSEFHHNKPIISKNIMNAFFKSRRNCNQATFSQTKFVNLEKFFESCVLL